MNDRELTDIGYKDMTVLQAIHMLYGAWPQVKPKKDKDLLCDI